MRERLLLITDRRLGDPVRQVARALAGLPRGAALVMLREKDLEGRQLFELARALREVTRDAAARLVVNDRIDVALAAGADGAHLPEDGLPIAVARALNQATLLPRVLTWATNFHIARGEYDQAKRYLDEAIRSRTMRAKSLISTPSAAWAFSNAKSISSRALLT